MRTEQKKNDKKIKNKHKNERKKKKRETFESDKVKQKECI
jgi:hypothetical protein